MGLIVKENKLLVEANKLATSTNCCCENKETDLCCHGTIPSELHATIIWLTQFTVSQDGTFGPETDVNITIYEGLVFRGAFLDFPNGFTLFGWSNPIIEHERIFVTCTGDYMSAFTFDRFSGFNNIVGVGLATILSCSPFFAFGKFAGVVAIGEGRRYLVEISE